MKEIYKFRIKEKRMFISGIVLLLILFVSWFFESYFAEVMFFMDYDAPDLVKNAKEIMLHDILTWERYIDSAMRYVAVSYTHLCPDVWRCTFAPGIRRHRI